MEEGPDLLRKAGCVLEESKAEPEGGEDESSSGSSSGCGSSGTESGMSMKWEINTKDSVIDMSVVFSNDKLLL